MVRKNRTAVAKPSSLQNNAIKWKGEYLKAINSGDNKAKKRVEKKYNRPDVRKALLALFDNKCAYCEWPLDKTTLRIEHFRPKKFYPKQCFEWNNLLPSCETCNSKEFKGDLFPLATAGGPIINPSLEDPNTFLEFIYDPAINHAFINAKSIRGKTTITTLGLDRKTLACRRSKEVERFYRLAMVSNLSQDVFNVLHALVTDEQTSYRAFFIPIAQAFNII
jgi:uncharacterized protein (TIGR02646 family)